MTPGFNVSASTSSSLTQVSHTHSLALAFERGLVGIVERQVRKWICPSSSLLPLGIESHLKSCLEKLTHQKFLLPTENWDTLENSQDPLLGRDTSSSQMKSQFLYMTPLFCFFFLIVQWICRSKTWELSSLCLEALWPYRSHHLVLPFLWVWLGIAGGVRGAVQKVERTGQTLGVELPQLLKNLFLLVEYFTNLQIC